MGRSDSLDLDAGVQQFGGLLLFAVDWLPLADPQLSYVSLIGATEHHLLTDFS